MSLSRWSDNTEKTMEEIISNMLNYDDWNISVTDPLTNENLRYNITKSFENNKVIELNGAEINYNIIKYEYERVRTGEETNEMRSSRIYSIVGYIIVYSDNVRTQYITNKSNNDTTKTILRKINNYTGQGEIKSNPFQITEDLFIWMISKVLNSTDESIDESSHLVIKKIVGFKGSSHDQLAEVIGSGNRIMNALSTLAFLFENEEVTYVKPVIEYKNHTIELFLKLSGSIDINFENYLGDYFMDPTEELTAKVVLMVALEAIPNIIDRYGNDISNENWSINQKIELIKGIGESIQAKVNEKVSRLSSTGDF